jgi:uncharacterized coiled-coil protein SlyX
MDPTATTDLEKRLRFLEKEVAKIEKILEKLQDKLGRGEQSIGFFRNSFPAAG